MTAEAVSVSAPSGENDHSYRELFQIIKERGWMEKATARTMSELVFHVLLHFGGIALFLAVDNVFVGIVALYISAYGGLGIATNTHTSSHNANSHSSRVNKALTYFGYTFLFGTSAHYWWNKHCVVHHPAPNVIEVDVDADLMPWFAINEREIQESRGLARFFYRIQWIFIPFALGLNTFFTQYQGWRFLLPILFDGKRRRAVHWLDLGVLAAHWLAWAVIPMFFYPAPSVLGFYVLRMALMGYAMFAAFAPAHYPADAVFIDKSELPRDYVLRQCATTVNFKTGFFGRLACSGVDYQIEHHLFPGVPHVYYPAMSSVIQEFCRRRGYPYRTIGWGEGVWKSLVIFYRPKPVYDEVTAFLEEPRDEAGDSALRNRHPDRKSGELRVLHSVDS